MTAQTPPTAPPPYQPPASVPQQHYPPGAYQTVGHEADSSPGGSTVRGREIASEMHRWGRMTGVFSILAIMTWLLLDTVPSVSPALAAVKSTFLWPGIVLAILAGIGLAAGFGIQFLAGRRR